MVTFWKRVAEKVCLHEEKRDAFFTHYLGPSVGAASLEGILDEVLAKTQTRTRR